MASTPSYKRVPTRPAIPPILDLSGIRFKAPNPILSLASVSLEHENAQLKRRIAKLERERCQHEWPDQSAFGCYYH